MKTTTSTEVEWAIIAPDKVVIATAEGVWLDSPQSDSDRFTKPITGAGNTAITKQLLDGAMAAANIAVPLKEKPPALTPNRYVWQLAGAYQIAHATPELMREAGQRFASAERHILSEWAFEKAKEETGHDRLALLDIKSLGYRAEELVREIIPSASMTLVDYFRRSVHDVDPIDCVGYAHALERLAIGAKREHIDKIENLLPVNVNATRCFKVHSSVGADAEHVEENEEMIARLSFTERTRIIRACYETALLLFSPPKEGYLAEAELEEMLKPFRLETQV